MEQVLHVQAVADRPIHTRQVPHGLKTPHSTGKSVQHLGAVTRLPQVVTAMEQVLRVLHAGRQNRRIYTHMGRQYYMNLHTHIKVTKTAAIPAAPNQKDIQAVMHLGVGRTTEIRQTRIVPMVIVKHKNAHFQGVRHQIQYMYLLPLVLLVILRTQSATMLMEVVEHPVHSPRYMELH